MLGNILIVLTMLTMIVGFFYGVYQWFVLAGLMLSLPNYYRPGISPWSWRTAYNPFAGLIVFGLLTSEGQSRALSFWKACFKFALCVLVPFAMAYLTEVVTGEQIIHR